MSTDPDSFKPLLPAARIELARQLDKGKPDAEKLAAAGFGWTLAFQLVRQMGEGENASHLAAHGLSAPLATAIASALSTDHNGLKIRPSECLRRCEIRHDAHELNPLKVGAESNSC